MPTLPKPPEEVNGPDESGEVKVIRLGVTGGRDFFDKKFVFKTLDRLFYMMNDTKRDLVLIHGAANGLDTLADQWAHSRVVQVEPFPADWKKYDKAAGAIRNSIMVKSGIDFLVVFPGGIGTKDMKKKSLSAGIKCWEPKYVAS